MKGTKLNFCARAHYNSIQIFALSWVCLRTQTLEKLDDSTSSETVTVQKSYAASATDWCADADDWGDGNDNVSEENGNLINSIGNVEKISDEEEESCSLEAGFGNLNFDDKNANPGTEIQGEST